MKLVAKTFISLLATFALAGLLSAATTPPKTSKHRSHPAAKATASKSAHRSSATRGAKPTARTAKSTAHSTASKHTTARSRSRARRKTPHRTAQSYQQAPTPERYQEIQQALAKKGYFQGDPNGQWGPDSIDALKRFQNDQNLMPDGKINSLSLIALGLGPKRLTAQSKSTPAPAPASVPATQ
jgi:type IV secretory pathway TrbL component